MPQKRISIWTSLSVGSRRAMVVETNGDVCAGNGISFCVIHGELLGVARQFAPNSPVNQTTMEHCSSGILILPISCLFLSMHTFLCKKS